MSEPESARTKHWRRHDEQAATLVELEGDISAGRLVVASACGRLIDQRLAVGDPSAADCRECERVRRLLDNDDNDHRPFA